MVHCKTFPSDVEFQDKDTLVFSALLVGMCTYNQMLEGEILYLYTTRHYNAYE